MTKLEELAELTRRQFTHSLSAGLTVESSKANVRAVIQALMTPTNAIKETLQAIIDEQERREPL